MKVILFIETLNIKISWFLKTDKLNYEILEFENKGNYGETDICAGNFSAPEIQVENPKYTKSVDIFSLGQVLHYWLFFKTRKPLENESNDKYNDTTWIVDSTINLRPGISKSLHKICEDMIRK